MPTPRKKYANATECASSEFDFLTEDDYQLFAKEHPELIEDVKEIEKLSSKLGLAMQINLGELRYLSQREPLTGEHGERNENRKVSEALEETGRRFREKRVTVIKRVYTLENIKRSFFSIPVLILFGVGIIFLSVPAVDTFMQVLQNIIKYEMINIFS